MKMRAMHRTQILLEPEQHIILKDIAHQEKRSLSAVIREMVDRQVAERKKAALLFAAQALLADYRKDSELTAFQALDGEDFS